MKRLTTSALLACVLLTACDVSDGPKSPESEASSVDVPAFDRRVYMIEEDVKKVSFLENPRLVVAEMSCEKGDLGLGGGCECQVYGDKTRALVSAMPIQNDDKTGGFRCVCTPETVNVGISVTVICYDVDGSRLKKAEK